MVYYKYLCIAKPLSAGGSTARLMESMKKVAQTCLQHGGAFRKVENMGTRELGYAISRQDRTGKYEYEKFYEGNYFYMHFDTRPNVMPQIHNELNQCPEIIRYLPEKGQLNPYKNLGKKWAGGHLKKPFDAPAIDTDYERWAFI